MKTLFGITSGPTNGWLPELPVAADGWVFASSDHSAMLSALTLPRRKLRRTVIPADLCVAIGRVERNVVWTSSIDSALPDVKRIFVFQPLLAGMHRTHF